MSAPTGTREEWLTARVELLRREKELTRLRDELSAERRALPRVRIGERYDFDTEDGPKTLLDLFEGRQQLVVYHFMFGPDWEEGCPSCSFWMDSLDGNQIHLAHRDTSVVLVSRAPLDQLLAYRARMGWTLPWVSSAPSSFNVDFGVSFPPGAYPDDATYNFSPVGDDPAEEAPGLSTFWRDGDTVYHVYSTYARGLDAFNSAYQVLDLTALGRHEDGLPWTMAWLRRHDRYDD